MIALTRLPIRTYIQYDNIINLLQMGLRFLYLINLRDWD